MATSVNEFTPHALADALGGLAHVLKVYASQQGREVSVWTVVDCFDREVRDKIYSAERNLFTYFPDYTFDFNLVEGDAETIISDAKLVHHSVA